MPDGKQMLRIGLLIITNTESIKSEVLSGVKEILNNSNPKINGCKGIVKIQFFSARHPRIQRCATMADSQNSPCFRILINGLLL